MISLEKFHETPISLSPTLISEDILHKNRLMIMGYFRPEKNCRHCRFFSTKRFDLSLFLGINAIFLASIVLFWDLTTPPLPIQCCPRLHFVFLGSSSLSKNYPPQINWAKVSIIWRTEADFHQLFELYPVPLQSDLIPSFIAEWLFFAKSYLLTNYFFWKNIPKISAALVFVRKEQLEGWKYLPIMCYYRL